MDKPLPKLTTNGESGALDKFQQWGSGKTLRQLASERYDNGLNLIGTPDEVAARMGEAIEESGGDGFLISTPLQRISWRFINEICEGLVPAPQRRGLMHIYPVNTARDAARILSAEPVLPGMPTTLHSDAMRTLGERWHNGADLE